jgi:hypothetical protein
VVVVAFGADVGELLGDAEDLPVTILQNEKLLDDFLHLSQRLMAPEVQVNARPQPAERQ